MRSLTFVKPFSLALTLSLAGAAACSGDDPPPVEVPSGAEVRDFFGYNGGSCWRYRFSRGGANLFARAEMEGPNVTSVAEETVYVRSFRFDSGGLPEEWFLDTEEGGQVRLLRATTGDDRQSRETRRYDMTAPLFAELEYAFNSTEIELEGGERFESTVTPTLCTGEAQDCMPGPTEQHEWTVTSTNATVNTPEGEQNAFRWQYRIRTDEGTRTAIYNLVPGRGIANFVDFEGTQFQVCDWRVCDSAGDCIGAPSCNELACN